MRKGVPKGKLRRNGDQESDNRLLVGVGSLGLSRARQRNRRKRETGFTKRFTCVLRRLSHLFHTDGRSTLSETVSSLFQDGRLPLPGGGPLCRHLRSTFRYICAGDFSS